MTSQVGPGPGPGSGGGGSSILHQATVTLTNAQIKALPGTPVQIVAGISGCIIVPVLTCLTTTGFNDHPYTGMDADGYMALRVTSPFADVQDLLVNDSGIPLTDFTAFMALNNGLGVATAPFTQASYQGWGVTPAPNQYAQNDGTPVYVGKAVVISINNNGSTTDLGGGNIANSMNVSVTYYIINTSTGQFE